MSRSNSLFAKNTFRVTSRYRSSGVSVSKYRQRVRVSVPNCDNVQLVMWVECEEVGGQEMLKFIISRGVNLQPTSHGLLGSYTVNNIIIVLLVYTRMNAAIMSTNTVNKI